MEPGPVVVGVDIAASRPCVAVAVRCGRTLEVVSWREADEREPGDRARLFEWLDGLGPVAVGVDAPQRPRRARGDAATRPRACDAELAHRRISIYQVPTRAVAEEADGLYTWMETGWEYFRELGRRGYEPPAPGAMAGMLGQAPAALEVYPHATFATLLGGTPPPKSTPRRAARARRHAARRRRGVGRVLRPRLAGRARGGAHRVALRAGPRRAARATTATATSGCRCRPARCWPPTGG